MRSESTRPPRPTTLRLDIQGLRAVAVGAVVLNHLNGSPTGGFLGVDVFFVISGFLITSLLLREHERTGRISLADFYRRRVKRILPLAALVLLATVAVSPLFFNSVRAEGVRTDALWAAGFAANWHSVVTGTDYFAAGGPLSPLEHYWSLSVEEQFYLVWPLLLIAVVSLVRGARAQRGALLTAMLSLTVASLVFALFSTGDSPTTAYFSTFTRAWELGAGVLLALTQSLWARMPRRVAAAAMWLGLAGIVASFLLIDDTFAVPGPWSTSAVGATALVIAAGCRRDAPVPVLLANPVSRYLGDISYSLYLWHFPIFVIVATLRPDGSARDHALAVALAVGGSVAAHHLVEKPIMTSPWLKHRAGSASGRAAWTAWRADTTRTFRSTGLATLAAATIAIVAASLVIGRAAPPSTAIVLPEATSDSNGAPAAGKPGAAGTPGPAVAAVQTRIRAALGATTWPALDPTIDSVLDGTRTGSAHLACGAYDGTRPPQSECTFGPSTATKTLVLVGDSTSMRYLDTLADLVEAPDSKWRLVVMSRFACPFVDISIASPVELTAGCDDHNRTTVEAVTALAPDIVITTNSYVTWQHADSGKDVSAAEWTAGYRSFATRIHATGARVVSLTPPPSGADLKACYTPQSAPSACVTRTAPAWFGVRDAEATALRTVDGDLVDTRPMFCLDDLCPAFIGTIPVKDDAVHMTTAYAHEIAEPLAEMLTDGGVLPTGGVAE